MAAFQEFLLTLDDDDPERKEKALRYFANAELRVGGRYTKAFRAMLRENRKFEREYAGQPSRAGVLRAARLVREFNEEYDNSAPPDDALLLFYDEIGLWLALPSGDVIEMPLLAALNEHWATENERLSKELAAQREHISIEESLTGTLFSRPKKIH